jgi:glycosyltransferase involved in cell wall biosynthesis
MSVQQPRVIVLHDYFGIRGGGERLILSLCEGIKADLCTAYWTDNSYPRPPGLKIRVLTDKVPTGAKIFYLKRLFLHHTEFLKEYDICIYSGQASIYAAQNHDCGRNIYYCHTPPRYIFDQKAFYRSRYRWWLRPFFELLMAYLGHSYMSCIRNMDDVLANSNNVKGRLQKYLGIESQVIYPPIDIIGFRWQSQGDYYLSTARLDPLKRVNMIIAAFKLLPGKKLVVISGGSEEDKLRELAQDSPNIQITGWQSDEQIRDWVGNAIATIYLPVDEDFGMSPVESLAAGKPVIGVAEGGLLETVQHGKTGVLLPKQLTVNEIVKAVRFMDRDVALSLRESCEGSAKKFSQEKFIEAMKAVLHFSTYSSGLK